MKLAMFPAFQHDVLIFVTDKKVNPVYHSKAYKIKLVLVPEFIFGAHDSLNVHYLIGNAKINKPFRRTTCQRGTSASTSFSPRRHSRQAMGRTACLMGHKVLYLSMNKFLEAIVQARLDGSYLKWIKNIAAHAVVILDDFGLKPLSHDAKLTLLDILEDRYAKGSTIITSQLPLDKWHVFLNEATIADSILDRLTADVHKVDLLGSSWRKRK